MELVRFMTKSRPYSIWIPNFETTSGGIRVLWGLMGWLLTRGQVVIPNATKQQGDFITIYPEVVHGNPFMADRVVRYILATPGVMGMGGVPGPVKFDDSEEKYVFSELYNTEKVPIKRVMFLPILDIFTFKVTNEVKRTKRCKLVGKGQDLHLKETEGLFEITRDFASNQTKLAELLNECDVMYSYDPNTAMFEIARLCGCRVVIIPSMYTRDQFSKYEPGMNGISWGVEENTPLDVEGFRKHYIHLRSKFSKQLDDFIEDTQND